MKTRPFVGLSIITVLLVTFTKTPIIVTANDPTPLTGSAVETSQNLPSLQFTGCSPIYLAAINPVYEQQVVELVNIERINSGLPPLKRVSQLDAAARFHAKDMAVDAYFSHDSYDRSGDNLYKVCGWAERVGGFFPAWTWLGENIAAG